MPGHLSALRFVGVSAGPDGSGYHRMYQPFHALEKYSRHLAQIPPPGATPPPPTAAEAADWDVFVCQRPIGVQGMRMWADLEGTVARVYENDDDILRPDSSGLPVLDDERIRESVRFMVARAELVTVSTPFLAERMAAFNKNVVVLPNCVHERLLRLDRIHNDKVTLGWSGGASHLTDICSAQDALIRVLEANPQVDMHFIGVDYSPLVRRPCRFTRWQEKVWAYYSGIDFDIAIAPLADIPFNQSKSHLKALEMGALGIPIVAQDMEPYRDYVRDGETGYLVRTHDEWVARITELINDEGARLEMGAKAKQVAAQWTIQKRWPEWEAAYESAVR